MLALVDLGPLRNALVVSGEAGHLFRDDLQGLAVSLSTSEKKMPLSPRELLAPFWENGSMRSAPGESNTEDVLSACTCLPFGMWLLNGWAASLSSVHTLISLGQEPMEDCPVAWHAYRSSCDCRRAAALACDVSTWEV